MKKRKSISISNEILVKIEEIAKNKGRNFSNFIEYICKNYIKQNENKND